MRYDKTNDRGFWDDEPTSPLQRIRSRMSPAGEQPYQPTRPYSPPAGRSHTGEVPVVQRRGPARPGQPRATAPRTARPAAARRAQPGLADMFADFTTKARQATSRAAQQLSARMPRPAVKGRSRKSAAGLDPVVRRLGMMVMVILLAVPVALAMRSGDAESESLRANPADLATPTEPTQAPATEATQAVVAQVVVVETPAPTAATTAPTTATTAAPATTAAAVVRTAVSTKLNPPSCRNTYKVVRGDSWSKIAKKVGVSTQAMLDANNANKRTVIMPGNKVCLASGATNTTTAPPTTAKPKPTATPTTVKKPTTTTPTPTTTRVTAPAQRREYTKDEVIQMIRDVWPDEYEEKAIQIANRESHFNPYSANSCCYGVFQINYNAHKRWLPTIGVTSAAQLFDPLINIKAAYVVFQRSGNTFKPWGG